MGESAVGAADELADSIEGPQGERLWVALPWMERLIAEPRARFRQLELQRACLGGLA